MFFPHSGYYSSIRYRQANVLSLPVGFSSRDCLLPCFLCCPEAFYVKSVVGLPPRVKPKSESPFLPLHCVRCCLGFLLAISGFQASPWGLWSMWSWLTGKAIDGGLISSCYMWPSSFLGTVWWKLCLFCSGCFRVVIMGTYVWTFYFVHCCVSVSVQHHAVSLPLHRSITGNLVWPLHQHCSFFPCWTWWFIRI